MIARSGERGLSGRSRTRREGDAFSLGDDPGDNMMAAIRWLAACLKRAGRAAQGCSCPRRAGLTTKRPGVLIAAVVAAIALGACSGQTVGASDVSSTVARLWV